MLGVLEFSTTLDSSAPIRMQNLIGKVAGHDIRLEFQPLILRSENHKQLQLINDYFHITSILIVNTFRIA